MAKWAAITAPVDLAFAAIRGPYYAVISSTNTAE
jgi:hypothetical protein